MKIWKKHVGSGGVLWLIIPPVYEVYRGYIVFAFSVTMFVCLCVCVCVNFFSFKDFSGTTGPRKLKFGTKLESFNSKVSVLESYRPTLNESKYRSLKNQNRLVYNL